MRLKRRLLEAITKKQRRPDPQEQHRQEHRKEQEGFPTGASQELCWTAKRRPFFRAGFDRKA
jgi:hypothetical protein